MRYRGVLIDSISIIQTPFIYLILSLHLIKDAALWLKSLVLRRGIIIGLVIMLWIAIVKVDTLQVPTITNRPLKIWASSASTGSY